MGVIVKGRGVQRGKEDIAIEIKVMTAESTEEATSITTAIDLVMTIIIRAGRAKLIQNRMTQLMPNTVQWTLTEKIGPHLLSEMERPTMNTNEPVSIVVAAVTAREMGTIRLTEITDTSAVVTTTEIAAIDTDLVITDIVQKDMKDAGLIIRGVDVNMPRLLIQNMIGLEIHALAGTTDMNVDNHGVDLPRVKILSILIANILRHAHVYTLSFVSLVATWRNNRASTLLLICKRLLRKFER
jgi:hypothetical protein